MNIDLCELLENKFVSFLSFLIMFVFTVFVFDLPLHENIFIQFIQLVLS